MCTFLALGICKSPVSILTGVRRRSRCAAAIAAFVSSHGHNADGKDNQTAKNKKNVRLVRTKNEEKAIRTAKKN